MKRLTFVLVLILLAGNISASETGIAERIFKPNAINLELTSKGLTPSGSPSFKAAMDPEALNPGKAILLSAIVPGAGQFYVGSPLRGALFLAIEIAAWTGVVYYYNEGQDKDKEFKIFADEHFDESSYRDREFLLAQSSQFGDSGAYMNNEENWIREEWDKKIHFLPSEGFTHELPSSEDRAASRSHDQQYYEMIGKYIHQFGIGWDRGGEYNDFREDDPSTPYFDGDCNISILYMDMRYDSNKMLDYSSYAIQIAMLNHVAAALEAGFEVRAMKRNARAELGFRQVKYDDHPMMVGGLNILW